MVVKSPIIVNWLITRRCNLKCSFCGIVRQPDHPIYDIKDKLRNELRFKDMKPIIDFLAEFEPKPFIILYGGEPTLHPDIETIVDYLNEVDMPYTLITNATGSYVREKLYKLVNDHNLKGLSMSLDPLVFDPNLQSLDPDRYKKAKSALDLLKHYKDNYPNLDAVAEITVDAKNVYYLERLLQFLDENDIYASITTIERRVDLNYDFASLDVDESLLIKPGTKEYEIFSTVIDRILAFKKYKKVHFPKVLRVLINSLPNCYKCKLEPTNLTIDSDGLVRICLRIHGQFNPNMLDLIKLSKEEALEKIREWMKELGKAMCKGCAWTCAMMTDLASEEPEFYKEITHAED